MIVSARTRALGAMDVQRLLPYARRRSVGPFVFFDHFGPQTISPGAPADVRPHPHVGIATVTYLYDGELVHRDSLGSVQPIRPGELNLMIAGTGIVHSERLPPILRHRAHRSHGLQLWLALPAEHEDMAPSFAHYPTTDFPEFFVQGAEARLLMGSAWGRTSPVRFPAQTLYADLHLSERGDLTLPDAPERGVYVIDGEVSCGGAKAVEGELMIFADGADITIHAPIDAHLVLIGGEPIDGPRYMWWNFVATTNQRIEQAKQRWLENRFDPIPGDNEDATPLPVSRTTQRR
ncbi:MAG: pirin family protein [Myxococcota bacterium]